MKRLVLVLLGLVVGIAPTRQASAYRPFDSTDAAVADVKELEIELGPVGYRQGQGERTLIAPAYVLNYGFVKNWEFVAEGRGEHPLSPAAHTNSRLVGNAINLKGVLREGDLQGKSGPSVATEFGVLLPGVNDEQGYGLSWIGIVSQRWSWGTAHFDFGAELTRDHNTNLIVGTIIEGPFSWTVRPVAELRYERQFGFIKTDTLSALVGAIWKVMDNLSFDVGVREAWVNRLPKTELRAGLTVAFSPH